MLSDLAAFTQFQLKHSVTLFLLVKMTKENTDIIE